MRIFISALLCIVAIAAKAGDQIQLVRHGKNVIKSPSAMFASNVIDLLQSCSVNSTAYAVKPETWRDLEHSDSFVHLTFTQSRDLMVMIQTGGQRHRQEKAIDQILVQLPERAWPDHIFAKSGTNVLSFTKYNPIALRRVASEPVLRLSSIEPYSSLAKLPDK
jgi:hypothetical protein